MKKNKKKAKGIVQRYVEAEGKKNFKVSALKTGVEGIAGASVGAGLAALFGIGAVPAGLVTIFLGEYFGDKTNLTKAGGSAMVGYGIAKAMANTESARQGILNGISLGSLKDGAKNRLMEFKDNWLNAFYIDRLLPSKEDANNTSNDDGTKDAGIGSIDLSALDVFEDLNRQQAVRFEMERAQEEELMLTEGEEPFETMEESMEMEEMDEFETMRTVQEIDSLAGHYPEEMEYHFNTM